MDKQFLEFWGNLLLQAAKGQAQVENFSKWLSRSGSSVQTLTDLFKRAYGLDADRAFDPGQNPDLQKAFDRFKKAHEDYLAMLNVVPLERFRELEAQNEILQQEVTRLKADLKRMRGGSTDADKRQSEEVMTEFQDLLLKQQREFQSLTRQMSRFWSDPSKNQE